MLNLRTMAILAGIVASGAAVSHANAAVILLPGALANQPDLRMSFGNIVYVASTDTMTITGTVTQSTTNSVSAAVTAGTFSLTAKLTSTGTGGSQVFSPAATGSNLTITGNGTTLFHSTTLLQFGYDTTDNFQFVFGAGTGTDSVAGDKIDVNAHGEGGTGFTNLNTSFTQSNFTADSDTYSAVPEPASLSLLGLAAPMLLRRRRQA